MSTKVYRILVADGDMMAVSPWLIIRLTLLLVFTISAGVGMGVVAMAPRAFLETMRLTARAVALAEQNQEQAKLLATMQGACFGAPEEVRVVGKRKIALGGEK